MIINKIMTKINIGVEYAGRHIPVLIFPTIGAILLPFKAVVKEIHATIGDKHGSV